MHVHFDWPFCSAYTGTNNQRTYTEALADAASAAAKTAKNAAATAVDTVKEYTGAAAEGVENSTTSTGAPTPGQATGNLQLQPSYCISIFLQPVEFCLWHSIVSGHGTQTCEWQRRRKVEQS